MHDTHRDAMAGPPRSDAPGVFDAEGRFLDSARIRRDGAYELAGGTLRRVPEAMLPGRHLYGGQLNHHFGHFLCESLARLWLLGRDDGFASVVLLPRRRGASTELNRWQQELFALCGLRIPVKVLQAPTRIEELVIPEQGFGTHEMASGTPAFRDWVHTRFAPDIPAEGPEKLYISRESLSFAKGGIAGEDLIAAALAREGYEVFHPEAHSIEEQVRRYKAARFIVGSEGSALHLFGFVARPDQQVAILARRSDLVAAHTIAAQLAAFSGRDPLILNAIRREWDLTGSAETLSSKSVAEIDVRSTGAQLKEHGFVESGVWRKTPKKLAEQSMRRIARRTGRSFELRVDRDL